MAVKKSQLYSTLWKSCDELRGGMDASQYKDYVLTMLFWKYISDKAKSSPDSIIFEIPEGCTFDDIVKLKGKSDIGDQLNKKLEKIGTAFMLGEGFFHNSDFNDPKKLGTGKDLVDTVSGLISVFENPDLDFGHNRAADDDLIGDAYEYLMRNFAQKSGKSKGQFYTPAEASRLAAALLNIRDDKRPNISIYDMTCGSGSLLLRAANESRAITTTLYGQDKDIATVHMAKLNMILHGMAGYEDLKQGDTINAPQHTDPEDPEHKLMKFDYCVANPPYSVKNWRKSALEQDSYGRWNNTKGIPPKSKGDFAFLLHMIKSMKFDGRGSCFLPHGVLFRGSVEKGEGEAMVRKYLIDHHLISGIIGLPPNIFYGTGIPTCILVIDKQAAKDSKGIFIINAKDGFKKDGDKNRLREQDIRRVLDVWTTKEEVPHFAKLATWEEIIANGYNLNIPRYVTPADTEVQHDLNAHLHGGIPMADIDSYERLWEMCPTLKDDLFEQMSARKGYMQFTPHAESNMDSTISDNDSFKAQQTNFESTIDSWKEYMSKQLVDITQGCIPRELIIRWGKDILDRFCKTRSLVDPYAIYDELMQYWEETLQDDIYMISRDGWKVSIHLPVDKKGNIKKAYNYEEIACDLLPSTILAKSWFQSELDSVSKCNNEIEVLTSEMETLVEENEESFADFLSDKGTIKLADVKATLKKASKNPKDYDEEDIQLLKKYLDLSENLDKEKKKLKEQEASLTDKIYDKYNNISEDEVRDAVFHYKWLPAIMDRMQILMTNEHQKIISDLKELDQRYNRTLDSLTQDVREYEIAVIKHLKDMGFEL